MEGHVKKLVHAHLLVLGAAATVTLAIELSKFIRFIIQH